MEFLYPSFLFALAALAIPIIIHLFNFRRFKKVPFTNVRFLKEIKVRTQSQNRLQHLLVLLMRLLALAFLILAFAQPYLPSDGSTNKEKGKAISVFIDNSFSMEGENEEGPLLELAKNRAIDIAMAFEPTDRFQLLTQDFQGENQRFISRNAFIESVSNLDLSKRSRTIEMVMERQEDLINRTDNEFEKEAFIISDFQKSRFDFSAFKPDTSIKYGFVHLGRNAPGNLFIDSVWFPSPVRRASENERLSVRIVNTGDADLENVPLDLSINNKRKALGSFSVEGNSTVDTAIAFIHESPGIKLVEVGIEDYPVSYDNSFFLGYRVFDRLRILGIQENASRDFLGSAYQTDSTFTYQKRSINNLNYAELPSYDLIILNEVVEFPGGLQREISSFVENGGSLWIIPNPNADLTSYNRLLKDLNAGSLGEPIDRETKVSRINSESRIYRDIFESEPKNIDLPKTNRFFPISSPIGSTEENLLFLQGGGSFLSAFRKKGGNVYLQAVPLNSNANNFSRHAIFVATALRIAEMSRSTEVYQIEIGSEASFSIPYLLLSNESVFHLKNEQNQIDIIPRFRAGDGRITLYPGPDLTSAGKYILTLADSILTGVGFNYERTESNLESYTAEELSELIEFNGLNNVNVFAGESDQLQREIQEVVEGRELWKFCLILALIFLLLESLILRFGKRTAS